MLTDPREARPALTPGSDNCLPVSQEGTGKPGGGGGREGGGDREHWAVTPSSTGSPRPRLPLSLHLLPKVTGKVSAWKSSLASWPGSAHLSIFHHRPHTPSCSWSSITGFKTEHGCQGPRRQHVSTPESTRPGDTRTGRHPRVKDVHLWVDRSRLPSTSVFKIGKTVTSFKNPNLRKITVE